MSNAATNSTLEAAAAPGQDHAHDPHLAHHYDTPEQQYVSQKLGMWVFLGTEILMFGGLFCAYAVYRHNHPEVFLYAADKYLNKWLGGINTLVLITSSLTMAWGVRLAQLGARRGLMLCLALTLLGGACFMGIKGIEYRDKWEEHVWIGSDNNKYNKEYVGPDKAGAAETPAAPTAAAAPKPAAAPAAQPQQNWALDPNAGTADAAKIVPPSTAPKGLAHARHDSGELEYHQLGQAEKDRVNTFFSVYFMMTGLHGVHVLVGMLLIAWLFLRARRNEFGPKYFVPVDLVGLYWHLVDMIWIFLFPLLYLIH